MICFNKLLIVHTILVATTVNTVEGVFEGNETLDIDTSCKAAPSDEKLWGLVELHNGKELRRFDAFTSPVELCESYNLVQPNRSDDDDNGKKIDNCINVAQEAESHPLRCVVIDTNDNSSSVIGVDRYSTFWKIAERLVWDRIAVILFVIILMTYYQFGIHHQSWQSILLLNVLFAIISAHVDAGWHHDGKWFSHLELRTIIRESFIAFRAVHPVDNVAVCVAHFLTYWIHAAAWVAKTPRQVFVWSLLTDVIVSLVNEWAHHDEWKTDVRCARVAFIGGMKGNGYDNLWREFLFGPFFVYFYLLPKFIIHWARELMA